MPNRPTEPSRRNASWSLVCLLALLWLPVPASAQSEVDADFQAYCRTRHSGSLYQRTGNDHFCRQGTTLQGIDLAEACRLTTGNREYRRVDWRVLCPTGGEASTSPPKASGEPLGAEDFRRYCSEKFPNSGYEKRNESWGVVHYCRRAGATGGYSLQQIDLTDACRLIRNADSYEMDGNRVRCRRGAGDPPRPPMPGPFAVPPGAGATPSDPEQMVAGACQSLGGKWRSGTIPMVEKIVSDMQGTTANREANCISAQGWEERCRTGARVEQSVVAYFNTIMIWQCHLAVVRFAEMFEPEEVRTARQEGCIIQRTLDDIRDVTHREAGTMQTSPHQGMLEAAGINSLCGEAVIRFVHAPSKDDKLPYFEPIHVEVEFEKEQEESVREVAVETRFSSITLEVHRVTPKLYRSRTPFLLEEPAALGVKP